MEMVDLESLKRTVLSDLDAIKEFTTIAFYTVYSGFCGDSEFYEDFNYLFDGVMSLDDFANFVYFTHFTGCYLNVEAKKSINKQFVEFQEIHAIDSLGKECAQMSKEKVDAFFDSWPLGDPQKVRRSLYDNINAMVAAKKIPSDPTFEEDRWRAIRSLAEYRADTTLSKREGTPIGKSMFYQVVFQTKLRKSNRNVLSWMASDYTCTSDYIKFYKAAFISKYVLDCDPVDLRNVVYMERSGSVELNYLAVKKYRLEADRIMSMIQYGERHKEEYCFERFVCRWLGRKLPEHADSWLDDNISGYAHEEFAFFMNQNKQIPMTKEAFEEFSKQFQKKCLAAFGKEKNDRTDRIWGEQKINDKLKMNHQPYELIYDNQKKIYTVKLLTAPTDEN